MNDTSSLLQIRLSDFWLNLSSFASAHLGYSCRAVSDRVGEQTAVIWDEQIILDHDGNLPRLALRYSLLKRVSRLPC